MAAIPALESLTVIGASRKAELSIAVSVTLNGLDIDVSNGKPLDRGTMTDLATLAETHGFARLTWNEEPVIARSPAIHEIVGVRLAPPPGAFMQATIEGQDSLIDLVRDCVGDAKSVVDLFAGCGTFTLPLAKTAAVHGVESVDALLEALSQASRMATGLKPVTTQRRDLFRNPLLPEELSKFDAIVIDPPRAGAEAQTRMIADSAVSTVAFVSCNPVTFALDAKTLTDAGYKIDWLQPIDQFRWSSHVELVAKFTRS